MLLFYDKYGHEKDHIRPLRLSKYPLPEEVNKRVTTSDHPDLSVTFSA